MGCRILSDRADENAALYCSTTGVAFGPIFSDEGDGAEAEAELFCKWVEVDPRRLTDSALQAKYSEWLGVREAFKKRLQEEADAQIY